MKKAINYKRRGIIWLICGPLLLACTLSAFAVVQFVVAQTTPSPIIEPADKHVGIQADDLTAAMATDTVANSTSEVDMTSGLSAQDTRSTVVSIIRVVLSLLGIIALVLTMVGIPLGIINLGKSGTSPSEEEHLVENKSPLTHWPVWIGYAVLVVPYLFISMFDSVSVQYASAFVVLIGIAVFPLVLIHQMHKAIEANTRGTYSVSPSKAVWYNFIPLFNIYWHFAWFTAVIRFLKKYQGEEVKESSMMALYIIGFLLYGLFFPLGYLCTLGAMHIMIKQLHTLFDEPASENSLLKQ